MGLMYGTSESPLGYAGVLVGVELLWRTFSFRSLVSWPIERAGADADTNATETEANATMVEEQPQLHAYEGVIPQIVSCAWNTAVGTTVEPESIRGEEEHLLQPWWRADAPDLVGLLATLALIAILLYVTRMVMVKEVVITNRPNATATKDRIAFQNYRFALFSYGWAPPVLAIGAAFMYLFRTLSLPGCTPFYGIHEALHRPVNAVLLLGFLLVFFFVLIRAWAVLVQGNDRSSLIRSIRTQKVYLREKRRDMEAAERELGQPVDVALTMGAITLAVRGLNHLEWCFLSFLFVWSVPPPPLARWEWKIRSCPFFPSVAGVDVGWVHFWRIRDPL